MVEIPDIIQGSRYSLRTLKSPGIEKAFSRALEKPLKIIKMSKILEKSLNLYILFVDLSLYDTVVIQIWQM